MKVKRPVFLLIFFIFLISAASAQETNNQTAKAVISSDLRILNYEFNDGNFSAIFDSDKPVRIVVVDANSLAESGSSKPKVKSKQLGVGKTELSMNLKVGRRDAVFISTSDNNFLSLSDPGKPFLSGIGMVDLLYALAGQPFYVFLGVIGLRKWEYYRLGQGLVYSG